MTRKAIMVDLEGTLTDDSNRPIVNDPESLHNWNEEIINDPVRMEIAELVAALSVGYDIIITSAKPVEYANLAVSWINNNIPFNLQRAMFRPKGNMNSSPDLKLEYYNTITEYQKVALVIDDREDVCAVFNKLGIPAINCKNHKKIKKKEKSTPGDILRMKANLFSKKDSEYADGYKRNGKILKGLFPGGLCLETEYDFTRFANLIMIMAKINRYCGKFVSGGHDDSLDDLMVYSAMQKELDNL